MTLSCAITAMDSSSLPSGSADGPIILEESQQSDELATLPKLSKRQVKKQARMEQFLANRKERRKLEKKKAGEKRRAKAAAGIREEKTKLHSMNESKCRIRVAVDMAYDELMDGRTVRKAVSQLAFCYSANRRAPNPLQFYIVNVDGQAKEMFNSIPGYANWDAHILPQSLKGLWNADEGLHLTSQIVYLTADSPNELTALEEEKVYIIGGLLDHNHHKGICLERAKQFGFGHARLPIDSFFRLSGRKVLTINQVFEILVRFSQDRDWKRAFLDVIPKRKGIESREEEEEEEEGQEDGDEEELPIPNASE